MNGEFSDDNDDISESEIVPIKFVERRRIIETILSNLLIFADWKGFRRYVNLYIDMIVLYK